MKNVYHIIDRFYPIIGGAENQCLSLVKELHSRGVDSIIITKRYSGLSKEENIDGIIVKRLFYFSSKIKGKLFYVSTLFLFIIPLIIFILRNKKNIRILHFHGAIDLYGLVAFVALMFGIKSIAKVASFKQREAGDLKYAIGGGFRIKAVNNFSKIIAISKEVNDTLIREGYYKEKIAFIPNGVDIKKFSPTNKNRIELKQKLSLDIEKKYIIFVGRVVKVKNLEVLLRTFSKLLISDNDWSNYQILILGSGRGQVDSTEDELKKLVVDLKIEQLVSFVDLVKNVEEYLRASDIFILPSITEGLPNSLMEAMAMGISCVGSNIGGISDLIQNGVNGLLFESNQVNSLANCLNKLKNDIQLNKTLSESAKKFISENYSLNLTIDKYSMLYNELGV